MSTSISNSSEIVNKTDKTTSNYTAIYSATYSGTTMTIIFLEERKGGHGKSRSGYRSRKGGAAAAAGSHKNKTSSSPSFMETRPGSWFYYCGVFIIISFGIGVAV